MSEEGAAAKLKVFISYSRRDCGAFAEELLAGLELVGFEPFLDRHDIAAGEDWETRLAGLIQAADTIVYVVSPEAVRSERCAWEVEKATSLAKRLIPVVAIAVTEAEVPESLKRLNYIFFNEPHSFARALGELSSALRTDLDWIREHTRLGELAARWQQRNRLEALLLRGDELEAAKAWMAKWASGAPQLTDAHRAFIAASAEAEALRASKERLQIEEMAKAQAARAQALSER
ncbi:MAG: toll/interleukin-1 receptor domain-containing protein, partial [Hyphomicrobiales bacterium]